MRSQGEKPVDKRGNFTALLSLAAGVVLVLYPLLMYLGQTRLGATWLALIFVAMCVLRLAALRFGRTARLAGAVGAPQMLVILSALALALLSLWRGSSEALLYYPVLVNLAMLLAFGASLASPPTIVERIARSWHPDLPQEATPYLRRVTLAWCLFFFANGAVALYTATLASFETWALYNGFIAYLLIGAMFAGELLLRTRAMRSMGT
jgi:uncharacterized membrane protein